MTRLRTFGILLLASWIPLGLASCSSDGGRSTSPTPTPTPSPTPTPTPTPTPSPSTASVTGTVTDASSGAPLAQATVAAGGRTATTGADGRYSLTDLTPGPVTLTAQRQGHRNHSQSVTLESGSNTSNVMMTPAVAAGFAGAWSGSWTNTTFGSTGAATATVTANTIDQTMQIVLDMGGGVFGGGDPAPETYSFPYETGGSTFSTTSPSYGLINATATATGSISGTLTNVPNPNISRVEFNGTATPQSFSGSAVIHFASGSTANATLSMTKQGGASTASIVLSQIVARVRTWLN